METKKEVTLWGISEDLEQIGLLIAENEGEITEDIEKKLEAIGELLISKTEGCVKFVEREKDMIKLGKEKIKQLQDWVNAREANIERFTGYIDLCLKKMNTDEISGDMYSIKRRKPAQVLTIINEDRIPVEFVTVENVTTIDKKALKEAVKRGEIDERDAYIADSEKPSIKFCLKTQSKKKKEKENE